jgi:ElaB/YqjD/DUF883 family membrane-anchored ribosome-binding protein
MQNPGMQSSTGGDRNGIDRAAASAHQTVDKVASAAQSTKDRLLTTGEQWYVQSQRGVEYTRECVRSHPLASVAVAVAAGVLISRLFSSRN